MPELRFHLARIGHGIRDLLPKEFAVSLAKPVNGHFQCPLRRVQFLRQCGIRRVGLPEKENLQTLEMLGAAVLDELAPQSFHDAIEHRKRPAALEDPLGRLIMGRLASVSLFARREFKRRNHTAAALACALAIFLVSHEEFQGSQKKRPEPALLWFRAIEISPFEHADKELLG